MYCYTHVQCVLNCYLPGETRKGRFGVIGHTETLISRCRTVSLVGKELIGAIERRKSTTTN